MGWVSTQRARLNKRSSSGISSAAISCTGGMRTLAQGACGLC
nr:hypothetical protein [Humibacillus sp. DSM 29435]